MVVRNGVFFKLQSSVLIMNKFSLKKNKKNNCTEIIKSMTYSDRLRERYTGFGAQKVWFQLYSNKKYVEVATNDFTVHLIISK